MLHPVPKILPSQGLSCKQDDREALTQIPCYVSSTILLSLLRVADVCAVYVDAGVSSSRWLRTKTRSNFPSQSTLRTTCNSTLARSGGPDEARKRLHRRELLLAMLTMKVTLMVTTLSGTEKMRVTTLGWASALLHKCSACASRVMTEKIATRTKRVTSNVCEQTRARALRKDLVSSRRLLKAGQRTTSLSLRPDPLPVDLRRRAAQRMSTSLVNSLFQLLQLPKPTHLRDSHSQSKSSDRNEAKLETYKAI